MGKGERLQADGIRLATARVAPGWMTEAEAMELAPGLRTGARSAPAPATNKDLRPPGGGSGETPPGTPSA